MTGMTLRPLPLTAERFAAYGDVIAASPESRAAMNEARFDRFNDLARVDAGSDSRINVSIVRCRAPSLLPYRIDTIERHPLGTQAFIPLARFSFIVVVAAAAESVEAADLRAFVTNGRQGVNYRKGVWHMPMIGLEHGQEFVVIDRLGQNDNCDEHILSEPVTLLTR